MNMTYQGGTLVSGVPVILASNPEKTDEPDAPAELLGPLVEIAGIAPQDATARMQLIKAIVHHAEDILNVAAR